jgi:hypothetical protein
MKVKILTGFIIAAISVTAIVSTASRSENKTADEEESFPQHIEKVATKLFAEKKANKSPIPVASQKVSLEELAGYINKQYGIREDILRYIEKEIPPNNEKAQKAALKYAERSQFIYYKATQAEALEAYKEGSLALECLSYALPNRGWIDVSRGIEKLMRDTPERDKRMWYVDENYFGWKVLGSGNLSTKQKKRLCETGKY